MLILDSIQYKHTHSTRTHIQAFLSKQASHLYQYVYIWFYLKKVMHHCDTKKRSYIYILIYMITGSQHLNNTSTNTLISRSKHCPAHRRLCLQSL